MLCRVFGPFNLTKKNRPSSVNKKCILNLRVEKKSTELSRKKVTHFMKIICVIHVHNLNLWLAFYSISAR